VLRVFKRFERRSVHNLQEINNTFCSVVRQDKLKISNLVSVKYRD